MEAEFEILVLWWIWKILVAPIGSENIFRTVIESRGCAKYHSGVTDTGKVTNK